MTDREQMLNAECLRRTLHYCAETGVFTWLVRPARNVQVGYVAGNINSKGYRKINIKGQAYAAHRLAWLYMNGEWPINFIDHIDGHKDNNKISNLRCVTNSVNLQNQRRPMCRNKSGVLGVSKIKNKWVARLNFDGRTRHLGTFDTKESAYAEYLKAKRVHHAGCML